MVKPSARIIYEFEGFRLDSAHLMLYRGDEEISLAPKAVQTLLTLIERRGEILDKVELMETIWNDSIVEEANLAQYVHILRKILGVSANGEPFIETLKRRGYRFNGAVRVVSNSNDPSPVEEAGNFKAGPDKPPPAANLNSRRVERRGNLQAVSRAEPARETHHPMNVERSGNLYSVSDWHRESAADPSPAAAATRSKLFSTLILVLLTAGLAGIVFGVYKFAARGRGSETRIIPFLGSDITRLTTNGRSKLVAISPDGRYIAHVMEDADGDSLWIRQVAVANDTRIAGPSQIDLVWVTFAPDGNFVYFLSLERDKGEPELFRVPVLGGPIVKVAHDIAPPTFSPDGTRIAFMKTFEEETRLLVANADGTNEEVIAARRDPDYLNMFWNAPAWSLDGKSLAFPVNQSDENGRYETVLAVDVETRVERRLTGARWQQVGQPRWLADGLVLTASETSTGPQQLWHISLPDGTASRITRDLNDYRNLSLTADAKTLAVIQNHVVSNIWTAGKNAADAKQIMSEAGWLNELIWLPDGRLAYTSNAGGSSDIWTMNADGSDVRQLTVGANARLGLAVTADQKQIIFAAERDGKYNLWRIEMDGSNLTRITDGNGEFYPQCTPDGRWIVYQSGGNYPSLWKMPVGGGEAVRITKITGSRPSISPDGKLVAYHYLDPDFAASRWSIGISRLEDGARVRRFDFPATVVERIVKWTPDGKAIAFLNSPGGVQNIWTQPVDGGEPKPLTNFPSDRIISFNWNADGSRLAVIRGVETSDVILK
ncbi:MAG: PD40 domain-containing protein [Acidobacteria bacterium]|nr:PD40 domain-containing protein [Acidobacteriota bacterium]